MGQQSKNDFMAAKNLWQKWNPSGDLYEMGVCCPQNDAFVLCQMAINKYVCGVYTIKRYVINDSFVVSITFE